MVCPITQGDHDNITNLQSWNVTNQRYVFCLAPAMWQLQVVSSSSPCYQAKFLQYPCQPVLRCRAWTSPRSHENLSPISITARTSVSTVEHYGFYDAALPIWWLEHAPIQWDSVQHSAVLPDALSNAITDLHRVSAKTEQELSKWKSTSTIELGYTPI